MTFDDENKLDIYGCLCSSGDSVVKLIEVLKKGDSTKKDGS